MSPAPPFGAGGNPFDPGPGGLGDASGSFSPAEWPNLEAARAIVLEFGHPWGVPGYYEPQSPGEPIPQWPKLEEVFYTWIVPDGATPEALRALAAQQESHTGRPRVALPKVGAVLRPLVLVGIDAIQSALLDAGRANRRATRDVSADIDRVLELAFGGGGLIEHFAPHLELDGDTVSFGKVDLKPPVGPGEQEVTYTVLDVWPVDLQVANALLDGLGFQAKRARAAAPFSAERDKRLRGAFGAINRLSRLVEDPTPGDPNFGFRDTFAGA
jgi:hypothetical protein